MYIRLPPNAIVFTIIVSIGLTIARGRRDSDSQKSSDQKLGKVHWIILTSLK